MQIHNFKWLTLQALFLLIILCSCNKKNTSQQDELKEYHYEGIQKGSLSSKLKDSNQNYNFTNWDTSYTDDMTVRMNITKKLISFIFNKSDHPSSPDATEFVTTMQHGVYSIPLGYRVRYDFRFLQDSLIAEYYHLDGLTDTFFVNKRLFFSGKRID